MHEGKPLMAGAYRAQSSVSFLSIRMFIVSVDQDVYLAVFFGRLLLSRLIVVGGITIRCSYL